MQNRFIAGASALALTTLALAAPASATTRTVNSCDTHGGRSGETVCAFVKVAFVDCDPVRVDVRSTTIKVTRGAGHLEDQDPLRDTSFAVYDGYGRTVFARNPHDIQRDADGSVDETVKSVANHRQKAGAGHFIGEVNVNNDYNWDYDIWVKFGPYTKAQCTG